MAVRRQREGEDGFTLIELLVVITLLLVVSGVATGGMISAFKTERKQVERTDQLNALKTTFERTTRDIRGSNPVSVAQPDLLTFTVLDGSTQSVITYRPVTTGGTTSLEKTAVVRTLPAGAATTTTTVAMRRIKAGGAPIFAYTDDAGAPLTALSTPTAGCVAASACYDASAVRSVTMTLQAVLTGTTKTYDLAATVAVRNKKD